MRTMRTGDVILIVAATWLAANLATVLCAVVAHRQRDRRAREQQARRLTALAEPFTDRVARASLAELDRDLERLLGPVCDLEASWAMPTREPAR